MKKPRNPVDVMNSVDALDLLTRARRFLKLSDNGRLAAFLARMQEQIERHKFALRNVISDHDEAFEPRGAR